MRAYEKSSLIVGNKNNIYSALLLSNKLRLISPLFSGVNFGVVGLNTVVIAGFYHQMGPLQCHIFNHRVRHFCLLEAIFGKVQ